MSCSDSGRPRSLYIFGRTKRNNHPKIKTHQNNKPKINNTLDPEASNCDQDRRTEKVEQRKATRAMAASMSCIDSGRPLSLSLSLSLGDVKRDETRGGDVSGCVPLLSVSLSLSLDKPSVSFINLEKA